MKPIGNVQYPTIRIEPANAWVPLDLRDIWAYRDLAFLLAWRDIKASYRQTFIGATWAILKPTLTMVMFSIIFGGLIGVSSGEVPYPIFVLAGLLPWQLFARALAGASASVVANESLITKVYFPRLVVPLSAAGAGILDFAVAFIVLLGMMVYYKITLTSALWMFPFLILLALGTALGVGLWLSALNVRYRDVGHALPFVTQMWMFATPIIYPASMVPESYRLIYWLNPMVGVVEGFRWMLISAGSWPGKLMTLSVLTAFVVLVSGLFYFARTEQTFADSV